MEEKLQALEEAWRSFIIEFPTYPKIAAYGREESQRILFLCPTQEKNPTELCLALFGTQILIQRLQLSEVHDSLAASRFIFVYALDQPRALWEVIAHYLRRINAPVLVAMKSNVRQSAQAVNDFLTRVATPFNESSAPNWNDSTQPSRARAHLDESVTALPDDANLWQNGLPGITMVDGDGTSVSAAAEIQDYRAEYACRFVLSHFQENINRDKMAELVNLSPGYFSNLFRAEVGMSFSDYLIQVRIENAKRLLRRFDLSVEAISKQCGFNSLAHFSRTFKDRCGLSPLKYRKSPNSIA